MFHLEDSGLPNVWLTSGYRTGEDEFGPYFSIDDIPGLYRTLLPVLAHGFGVMTAGQLRLIRRTLKLTQVELGALLGRTEQSVLLWERDGKIPEDVNQPAPEKIVLCHEAGQWLHVMDSNEYRTTIKWGVPISMQGFVDISGSTNSSPSAIKAGTTVKFVSVFSQDENVVWQ
jgi:DNA-binding XRE family transcriptional regulator